MGKVFEHLSRPFESLPRILLAISYLALCGFIIASTLHIALIPFRDSSAQEQMTRVANTLVQKNKVTPPLTTPKQARVVTALTFDSIFHTISFVDADTKANASMMPLSKTINEETGQEEIVLVYCVSLITFNDEKAYFSCSNNREVTPILISIWATPESLRSAEKK